MDKTSTSKNLILYLYNETRMTDSVLIQRSIDYDPEVEEEFENIKQAAKLLDRSLTRPSKDCIERILSYSRLTNLVNHS